MKKTTLLLLGFILGAGLFIGNTAFAQVSGSLWKLSANSLFPVNGTWSVTIPQLGGSGSGCVAVSNTGLLSFTTCAAGGTGVATTSLAATWPITISKTTSAITYGFDGLATTSPWTQGQVAYVVNGNTLTSVATSSFTPSSSFTTTGTLGALVGGSASTLDLSNTGVTAGTYGTGTSTPQFTVDAQGRLSFAQNVPIAIAGSKSYYAYATQATSSSAYYNMNPTASTTSTTVAYPLTTSPQTVQNWITPTGDPGVSVIPGGNYIVDLFAWRSSGTASITLQVQVWEVSSTGADVALIGTTNSTANLTGTKTQYQVAFTTGTHTMASTNDRLLMRVIATTSGTPTLSLAMGNGDQMDLTTPGATVDVTNFVPYTGATKNLDLGAFNASTTQLTVSGNTYLPLTGLLKGNGANNAVTTGVNGTDYTLITAKDCTSGGQFLQTVTAAGVFTCATPAGGSSFGQSFEIDASKWLSATTTNTYGINANTSGTTYGFGIGDQLLVYASSTNFSTILGLGAGGQNATTSSSLDFTSAFGYNSLHSLTTGTGNTGVGAFSLYTATSSDANTAIGYLSLELQNGSRNVGIGYSVMGGRTGYGSDNTAIGYQALLNNNSNFNLAIGSGALESHISGISNTAIGTNAGFEHTSGAQNLFLGSSAGYGVITGYTATGDVFIGSSAGSNIATSSDYNVGVGFDSGDSITSGYENVLIGSDPASVGNLTTGGGNLGIGSRILFPNGAGNNQLNIGNFLFGNLPATTTATSFTLPTSGKIGIGTSSPYAKLSIHSNNGDTATSLFAIGSSTASATTTLFSISNTGSIFTSLGTGLVKSTSGTLGLAVSGTDYAPATSGSSILSGNGSGGFTNVSLGLGLSFSSPNLTIATSSLYTGATGQIPYFSGTNALIGTSTITISTASNVGIGSTTPNFSLSVLGAGIGFYITKLGEIVGYDLANAWSGRISPTRNLSFKLATTTTWTGTSTTASPYGDNAVIIAPFTGQIKSLACKTDAGTMTIEAVNGASSAYLAGASTTANFNTFSLSFTKGDVITFIGGNPATSPTQAPCTFSAIETP